jgi:hypothetical protein
VARVAPGWRAPGEPLGDLRHALVGGPRAEGWDTPDHSESATARGVLKAALEGLAGQGAEG